MESGGRKREREWGVREWERGIGDLGGVTVVRTAGEHHGSVEELVADWTPEHGVHVLDLPVHGEEETGEV